MTTVIKSLSLIIPGLLDQIRPDAPDYQIRQHAGLRRLLDRADSSHVDVSGLDNTLIERVMGGHHSTSHAWLTRHGEQGEHAPMPAQRAWLRVDPVTMQADRDNVVLFSAQALGIQQAEADSLIAELNATYADLGWVFEAPDPQRWYLHIPSPPRIRCTPLAEMIGQNVRDLLPGGEDRLFWHRTLNEIQMLFYQSPVNLARREAGNIEINSVWIWGNGDQELPAPIQRKEQPDWSHFWGDEALLRGLAIASDIEIMPLPEDANSWLDHKPAASQLLVLSGLHQDSDSASDRDVVLQQYERDWFTPLLAMLRSRQLDVIEIWPCNGAVYRVTRSSLLRFWRKSGWQKMAKRA